MNKTWKFIGTMGNPDGNIYLRHGDEDVLYLGYSLEPKKAKKLLDALNKNVDVEKTSDKVTP